MSSSLEMEPVARKTTSLSDALKFAMREKYGTVDNTFSQEDIPYFEGMLGAGIKDAKRVIEAIERYGEIHIREQF